MTIPSFRTEHEARFVAERDKPLRTALASNLTADYARQYGQKAADQAALCLEYAKRGDHRAMHLAMVKLSLALPANVFDATKRRAA